jgi:hypothetical protein
VDDRNYKEILKQAQQILYCTTCGRTYQLDEIRLRGFLDDTVILQTICSNHHAPVVTFYLTNSQGQIEKTDKPVQLPAKVERSTPKKVTKNDVLDLHQNLKDFNGDFRKLWNMT